jgi:hypothetical protein
MDAPSDVTGWEVFSRPDSALRFQYPAMTPQGHAVARAEEQRPDGFRVHLTSPGSQELYVEVCRFAGLSVAEEHRRHRAYLGQRTDEVAITDLRAARLGQTPAQAYDFRVGERERSALLVQSGGTPTGSSTTRAPR